ncbi:hypothetical protein cyc_03505 [Cyclospora cayetanensis]|uniref:Uncharacterized protein n=1 Tax=Cyclospora cayetanensis TaxID=88456 RepID=A0A1D3CRS3_9EIME|nr:hypothetical protein cyc_03505 [Cyclospora cayetanensis]
METQKQQQKTDVEQQTMQEGLFQTQQLQNKLLEHHTQQDAAHEDCLEFYYHPQHLTRLQNEQQQQTQSKAQQAQEEYLKAPQEEQQSQQQQEQPQEILSKLLRTSDLCNEEATQGPGIVGVKLQEKVQTPCCSSIETTEQLRAASKAPAISSSPKFPRRQLPRQPQRPLVQKDICKLRKAPQRRSQNAMQPPQLVLQQHRRVKMLSDQKLRREQKQQGRQWLKQETMQQPEGKDLQLLLSQQQQQQQMAMDLQQEGPCGFNVPVQQQQKPPVQLHPPHAHAGQKHQQQASVQSGYEEGLGGSVSQPVACAASHVTTTRGTLNGCCNHLFLPASDAADLIIATMYPYEAPAAAFAPAAASEVDPRAFYPSPQQMLESNPLALPPPQQEQSLPKQMRTQQQPLYSEKEAQQQVHTQQQPLCSEKEAQQQRMLHPLGGPCRTGGCDAWLCRCSSRRRKFQEHP